MGERKRNWWWDRGYTSRGLAWFAVWYAALAVPWVALRLMDVTPNAWWWLLPVGFAGLSVFNAAQALRLRSRERSEEGDE